MTAETRYICLCSAETIGPVRAQEKTAPASVSCHSRTFAPCCMNLPLTAAKVLTSDPTPAVICSTDAAWNLESSQDMTFPGCRIALLDASGIKMNISPSVRSIDFPRITPRTALQRRNGNHFIGNSEAMVKRAKLNSRARVSALDVVGSAMRFPPPEMYCRCDQRESRKSAAVQATP